MVVLEVRLTSGGAVWSWSAVTSVLQVTLAGELRWGGAPEAPQGTASVRGNAGVQIHLTKYGIHEIPWNVSGLGSK